MNHVFRLVNGDDLKVKINEYVKSHNIEAGIVKCGVGCVYEAKFRLADGESIFYNKDNYEIVSLMGTVSKNGSHIHISLSDREGKTIGGHLVDGCLINTTCEVCIEELPNYKFNREYDESTGYKELVIEEVDNKTHLLKKI